jgi:recombinational DNA repair protein RecT
MTKQLSLIEQLQPTKSSLWDTVSKHKEDMLMCACDSIKDAPKEKQDQFLIQTIANIIKNDKLKECFESPEGRYSIFELVNDCLKTGLELDKHIYPIPYSKKVNDRWVKTVQSQINKAGYKAQLCGGSKPILKNLLSGVVYEKETNDIKINRATGEVDHPVFIGADRGKPVGAWVQAVHLDGHLEAEYYPISYVENIRNNHSKPYKKYLEALNDFNTKKSKYKPELPAWLSDPIPMIEKTAIKAFCRPYADVCEALQSAYYTEGDEIIDAKQNIDEVADAIVENAINNMENAEIIEPEPAKKQEVKKEDDDENLF